MNSILNLARLLHHLLYRREEKGYGHDYAGWIAKFRYKSKAKERPL